jgi:hypothetical protein
MGFFENLLRNRREDDKAQVEDHATGEFCPIFAASATWAKFN